MFRLLKILCSCFRLIISFADKERVYKFSHEQSFAQKVVAASICETLQSLLEEHNTRTKKGKRYLHVIIINFKNKNKKVYIISNSPETYAKAIHH